MSTPSRSTALFEHAQETIPGGVNSPIHAFRSAGGTPRFIAETAGPYLWDAGGTRYIGYVGSWGPMIVGYTHPNVVRAAQDVATDSFSFGAPTKAEVVTVEEICKLVPSTEQVRLVSSGIGVTMGTLWLARGSTGHDLIVKFGGCYHGYVDGLLIKVGSGLPTFANTTQNAFSSTGMPEDVVKHTMVLPYNNITALREAFARHGREIAAMIVEPVTGDMNLVHGSSEFYQAMRTLCTKRGVALIFDEVMTGFRVALGCTQALYGIKPNLACLGKMIGGGMPAATSDGRRDVMGFLAPLSNMYQTDTLSGNLLAVATGLTMLRLTAAKGFHNRLAIQTQKLVDGLAETAREAGVPFAADSVDGMFDIHFREGIPTSFAEVTKNDVGCFNALFHAMLGQDVYLAPSAFETGFVSTTRDDTILNVTFEAARKVLKGIWVSYIWRMGLSSASPVSSFVGTERGMDRQ